MSQRSVLEFLEKHPDKWFRPYEIQKHIGISESRVAQNLRALWKSVHIWSVYKRKEWRLQKNSNKGSYVTEYAYITPERRESADELYL